MSGEPPSKRRKTNKSRESERPPIITEMAQPIEEREEEEDRGRGRTRQLTVDEVPFDFLPPETKAKLEEEAVREVLEELEQKETEEKAKFKAKTLLGLFIGAGLGMYFAYLVKDKFIGAVSTVAAVAEELSEK